MIKFPLYVTLDTNIFDSNKLDFSKDSTLSLLINYVETGKIKIVLSNIVVKEVEKHIVRASEDICSAFRGLRKEVLKIVSKGLLEQIGVKTDLLLLDKEKYQEKSLDVWRKFLENLNPEILDLSLIDLNDIVDDYFDIKPPFESGEKKRKEFPDAFIANQIRKRFGKDTKSEIMNISIEQRFSRGIFLTPKLLGYDIGEDGNLVINEEEAETVRLCYYLFLNGFPTAEIADILTQLKRKTKPGNIKWSSSSIVSLLRNERYCGDVLSRKTFTPNYLDHKAKKNRHDRNQYRQSDHHEAIVDRDIYNAAQKMLTAARYAKKGFPFPNLKVVDEGALKGFVSVNRSWTGFTGEDYEKASQSAYSDQTDINDTEKEERKDSGFDLSGYEIVRAQFFSTRLNPAMTISEGKVTFNTACLKKFENVEYVEILFNSVEKCIAVRPCDKDDINAVKWGTIRNGKWVVLPKSCKGFSEPLFDLMNWNDECKYRFRGQYSKENNEQILLFDLEEPEVIKHEIIQEDLPDVNTSEGVKDTENKEENKIKKIVRTLFPKQWKNHFGCRTEEVVLLHRVKYCGNWDVLRPAKTIEGMEVISENLLKKLDNEAQNMIEKMRCAV